MERRRKPDRDRQYHRPTYRRLLATLAANVRRLREARGWSQEEAAHQCDGMATYQYRCVELGTTNITATTLARLADGFGVAVWQLVAPPDPAPTPPTDTAG